MRNDVKPPSTGKGHCQSFSNTNQAGLGAHRRCVTTGKAATLASTS
jgi:hypothetical protein